MAHFFRLQLSILLTIAFGTCSAQSAPNLAREMVYTVIEKQPEFPGGMDALTNYLRKNVGYPEAAVKANVAGRVFVSFIVERGGQLTDIHLLKGLGFGCDEEAMRVVQAMPRWKPGSQSGRPVRVKYNLPVQFGFGHEQSKKAFCMLDAITAHEVPIPPIPPESTPSIPPVCTFGPVESPPEFPGGAKALKQYLAEHTHYPEAAQKAGVSGRVFVSFVIDTAGAVSQVRVIKGLGLGCNEEAVRVVEQMPAPWKPGTMSGQVVAVKYNLPVQFGGEPLKSMQSQN